MEYANETIPVNTMEFIVRDDVPWKDSYYDLHLYVESYVEQRSIPSNQYV